MYTIQCDIFFLFKSLLTFLFLVSLTSVGAKKLDASEKKDTKLKPSERASVQVEKEAEVGADRYFLRRGSHWPGVLYAFNSFPIS